MPADQVLLLYWCGFSVLIKFFCWLGRWLSWRRLVLACRQSSHQTPGYEASLSACEPTCLSTRTKTGCVGTRRCYMYVTHTLYHYVLCGWCMTRYDFCRLHWSSKTATYGSFEDNCAGTLYFSILLLHIFCMLLPLYALLVQHHLHKGLRQADQATSHNTTTKYHIIILLYSTKSNIQHIISSLSHFFHPSSLGPSFQCQLILHCTLQALRCHAFAKWCTCKIYLGKWSQWALPFLLLCWSITVPNRYIFLIVGGSDLS